MTRPRGAQLQAPVVRPEEPLRRRFEGFETEQTPRKALKVKELCLSGRLGRLDSPRTSMKEWRIIWPGGRPLSGLAMLHSTPGRPLDALAAEVDRLPAVLRRDLRSGDWLVVTTRNSVYSLCLLEDGSYSVAGGWFDRNGESPRRLGVNGCTFGGRAIKSDVVAAPGLFLEFENRVTTTRIQEARILRSDPQLCH